MLKGYDSYNTLLLPPRVPGEKLPPEVYEYFKEMKRSKEEQMKAKFPESLAQENGESSGPRARLQPLRWRPGRVPAGRPATYRAAATCWAHAGASHISSVTSQNGPVLPTV